MLAVDARQTGNGWKCYLNGGRIETDKELMTWTKEAQERGAGEVLFTSMNHDGVKTGYANEAWRSWLPNSPYPLSHRAEQAGWSTSAMLLHLVKQMPHWQPVFFTSEKLKFPN